ncbi:MAG: type II toxin-antitoxin system death-on-curing family toxin [Candidatus Izemoplasmatales bacterium]
MIITIDFIIELQKRMINATGGIFGIKDMNILDSAISSVYQTFMGKDLYPSDVEKICRLSFNLNTSHPFIDGNKRISMHL